MRQAEITVYKFDELSKRAKDRVRYWVWQTDDTWHENVVEDFVSVVEAFGFTFQDRAGCRMMFWDLHRHDAGFSGTWSLIKARGVRARIAQEWCDEKLLLLADEIEISMTQFLVEIGELEWAVEFRIDGNHNCDAIMYGSADDLLFSEESLEALCAAVRTLVVSLCWWFLRSLEQEQDYRQSDEYIRETCAANEWEFFENGDRWN